MIAEILRKLLLLSVFFIVGTLSGCASIGPFHVDKKVDATGSKKGPPPYTGCFQKSRTPTGDACIRFVEYDDFGTVLSRTQLAETVEAARAVAANDGAIVVYVHGWHHNAENDDPDLIKFQKAINSAKRIIDATQKEVAATGQKREVLGIYVGWRGESLNVPFLNMITFWDRKTTAHAVGDGAVFELFRKLANHREAFPRSRLVLIGHSFGAAVTYSSVAHSVMEQIIRTREPETDSRRSTLDDPKRWDMVVLLNPAFEAMQIRSHMEMALSRRYARNQLPYLVIITSEGDQATRKLFSLGRYARSLLNKYYDSRSGDMYRTAIGHYLPYVTHQLDVKEDCTSFVDQLPRPHAEDEVSAQTKATFVCFDNKAVLGSLPGSKPVMWTRCEEAGSCDLVAKGYHFTVPSDFPILNIRTTSRVMNGHNDIWNPTMQAFLIQFLVKITRPAN